MRLIECHKILVAATVVFAVATNVSIGIANRWERLRRPAA
jgi:hypothetical protein